METLTSFLTGITMALGRTALGLGRFVFTNTFSSQCRPHRSGHKKGDHGPKESWHYLSNGASVMKRQLTVAMACLLSLTSMHAMAKVNLQAVAPGLNTVGNLHTGFITDLNVVQPPSASPETVPRGPYPVEITAKTATSLSVAWRDRSSVEDGYHVYLQASGGNWVLVTTYGPKDSQSNLEPYTHTFEALTPDMRYCFKAVPYNEAYGSPTYVDERCGYTNRLVPAGALVKRLRVLTHNVYGFRDGGLSDAAVVGGLVGLAGGGLVGGLAGAIVGSSAADALGLDFCEARLKAFGEAVAIAQPAYDIIGVQEYYNISDFDLKTCDSGPLREGIESTGLYQQPENASLFQPNGETWEWGPETDGGLGIFTRHTIVASQGHEWDETYWFGESPVQGFLFARIEIPGTDIAVDTYVVHTYSSGKDGCGPACHWTALQELAGAIQAYSGNSGNPVLIMGDFNIKGPVNAGQEEPVDCGAYDINDSQFDDYVELPPHYGYECILMAALENPRDLWLDNHQDHAAAAGYTSVGGQTRIDYLLVPTDASLTDSPYEIFIRNRDDVKVVKWGTGFGHVSDHFGVEATLEIREKATSIGGLGPLATFANPVSAGSKAGEQNGSITSAVPVLATSDTNPKSPSVSLARPFPTMKLRTVPDRANAPTTGRWTLPGKVLRLR